MLLFAAQSASKPDGEFALRAMYNFGVLDIPKDLDARVVASLLKLTEGCPSGDVKWELQEVGELRAMIIRAIITAQSRPDRGDTRR